MARFAAPSRSRVDVHRSPFGLVGGISTVPRVGTVSELGEFGGYPSRIPKTHQDLRVMFSYSLIRAIHDFYGPSLVQKESRRGEAEVGWF